MTPCTALLSPPFLPNHRRSRTQSNIQPICPSASANSHRTPARRALGILNTPPPKPTNSSQLKFKGSMTDPAHTRRRPSFGQVCVYFAINCINFTVTHVLCTNFRYPLSSSTSMRTHLNRIHHLFPPQLKRWSYKIPSTALGSRRSQNLSHSIYKARFLICSTYPLPSRHIQPALSVVAQAIGWRFLCPANICFAPLA